MTDNKERSQACPFCGGTENLLSSNGVASHYVFCNSYDCGAEGPVRETEDGAISAWNARSALAASQEKAEPVGRKIGYIKIGTDGCPRAQLTTSYDAAGNVWGDATPIYAAPVAAQASEPICNLWVDPVTKRYEVDHCTHPTNELIPVFAAPQPSAEAVRGAALEEAADVAMKAPITAGMADDKSAQALAFHASARILALKSAPPQPSTEAVRNAALEEAARLIETTNETTTVENGGETLRHLTERKGSGNLTGVAWVAAIRALKSAPPQPAEHTDELRVLINDAIHHCQMSNDMAARFTANRLREYIARAQGEQA